jgi:hypothetical protein
LALFADISLDAKITLKRKKRKILGADLIVTINKGDKLSLG